MTIKKLFEFSCLSFDNPSNYIQNSLIRVLDIPSRSPVSLQSIFNVHDSIFPFISIGRYFVVCLKRFYGSGANTEKIMTPVIIPDKIACKTIEQQHIFLQSIAVIEHIGDTIKSGHYVSYRRVEHASNTSSWLKTNDSTVSTVSLSEITQPYLVFFKQI